MAKYTCEVRWPSCQQNFARTCLLPALSSLAVIRDFMKSSKIRLQFRLFQASTVFLLVWEGSSLSTVISSSPPLFRLLQMPSSNKFGNCGHHEEASTPNRSLHPVALMGSPSSCLPQERFEYTRLYGCFQFKFFPGFHNIHDFLWRDLLMFQALFSWCIPPPFPRHTFHLSTTSMHIGSCCCCFFSTRGKAVHWRNQNSWMAWVQAFQKTGLSPFIQLSTQSTVSQGPFWTATAIALLGLLDLGLCAGLKRQKNVRHFVHWKPIILCAFKSNNFLHKFPIISSSSAPNVNTFHKSCIWTPQNCYF